MAYKTRTVKSSKGLSQEKALLTLQQHPEFKPGTKIASIYNQGGIWVAKLLEPKKASGWSDYGEALGDIAEVGGDILSAPIDAAGGIWNSGQALAQGDIGGAVTAPIAGGLAAVGDLGAAATDAAQHLHLPGGTTDAAIPSGYQKTDQAGGQSTEPSDASSPDANGLNSQGGEWDEFYAPASGKESATRRKAGDDLLDLDDSPADLHDDKHEKEESPLEEIEEHEEHEGDESKKLKELEKKLDLLLDALGISEKGEKPDSTDDLSAPAPDAPAPTPKGKGPKSDPLPPGSGAKLKPGEIPNKPGQVPVGSPAFSSVQPTSFVASQLDLDRILTIRQAKAQLENEFKGYRVARIKREGDYVHALVVR